MAAIAINTTTTQDARISPALQSILGLAVPPTTADVQNFLFQHLRDSVLDFERRQNIINFSPAAFT